MRYCVSKFADATCVGGVVKVDGQPIAATILSQGTKSSTGKAFMEKDKQVYVTSNATDIHDLIADLTDLVQKISDTFTHFATAMTGPTTAPPPTLATDLAALATIKTDLTAMKDNLK